MDLCTSAFSSFSLSSHHFTSYTLRVCWNVDLNNIDFGRTSEVIVRGVNNYRLRINHGSGNNKQIVVEILDYVDRRMTVIVKMWSAMSFICVQLLVLSFPPRGCRFLYSRKVEIFSSSLIIEKDACLLRCMRSLLAMQRFWFSNIFLIGLKQCGKILKIGRLLSVWGLQHW